jgi:hypothetical protein
MPAQAARRGAPAITGLRSVTSFSPGAAAPARTGLRPTPWGAPAGAQVLMAVVKVSRFPNGSVIVMSRVPQGMALTLGRACL